MNILFISIITGATADPRKLRRLSTPSPVPPPVPEESESLTSPDNLPWSVEDSNEVYVAAVRVGQAIAHVEQQRENFVGMHDLVMSILQAARTHAAASGLDHRRIIAGLADLVTVIESYSPSTTSGERAEGWWKQYARVAAYLLPVCCRVYEAALSSERVHSMLAAPPVRGSKSAKEVAAEFERKWTERLEGKGPVTIFDDRVIVECRPDDPGPVWAVPLAEIPNPTKLLKWVSDLTSKTWCTAEMVREFVSMVCSAKGWNPYATPNPGEATGA